MPQGTCVIRLQNSTDQKVTRLDQSAENVNWNQNPPNTVDAGTTSGNFQVSYDFNVEDQASFTMRYSLPNEQIPFTASALIEQVDGQVRLTPSGAGPGAHTVTFNVTGAAPNFTVLFTFN